jgi:hypothetical protein
MQQSFWLHIFSSLTAMLDGPFNVALDAILGRGVAWVGTFIIALCGFAIAIHAFAIATGHSQARARLMLTLFQVIVVVALTSQPLYSAYVRNLILVALPNDLSQLAGSTPAATAHAFDVVWNVSLDAGWHVWEKVGRLEFGRQLLVGLYFIMAIAAVVCGYGIWLLAHFAAIIYIALGVVLVPTLLFGITRPIFTAWLGVTASCVVLQALAIIAASVVSTVEATILAQVANDTASDVQMQTGMLLCACIVFLLAAWMMLKLPSAAAHICGGIHWTPQAITAATYGAIGAGAVAAGALARDYTQARTAAAISNVRRAAAVVPPGPSVSRAVGSP